MIAQTQPMKNAVASEINDLATILVTGDDATTFLQGQLSCDVTQLDNNWCYAALCNPQGRALALFHLWQPLDTNNKEYDKNSYCLTLPTELTETIIKRLQMYILRSNVKLTVLEEHFYYATVYSATTGSTNEKDTESNDNNPVNTLVSTEQGRYLLFANHALLITRDAVNTTLTTNSTVEKSNWSTLQVKAGQPQIVTATAGEFIPQMLNLDVLGGISMTKGCYTGQEIVARMHYLGKLKQRMYLLSRTTDSASPLPQPANDVLLADASDKKAGQIVHAASNDDKQYCLAVLRINYAEGHTTFVINGQTWQLDLTQQPYPLS